MDKNNALMLNKVIKESMFVSKVASSLFSNIKQEPYRTLDWVLNNKSEFDWV